jgi:Na+-transporting methylmalonyl-CoA/oxaloacetate decarboxylase gamma subunit
MKKISSYFLIFFMNIYLLSADENIVDDILTDQNLLKAEEITLIGMLFVFLALLFLSLFLYLFAFSYKKYIEFKSVQKETVSIVETNTNRTGEIDAAISMAIHLYLQEAHDIESNIITITRTSRPYSPWSSKIWNMRDLFHQFRI